MNTIQHMYRTQRLVYDKISSKTCLWSQTCPRIRNFNFLMHYTSKDSSTASLSFIILQTVCQCKFYAVFVVTLLYRYISCTRRIRADERALHKESSITSLQHLIYDLCERLYEIIYLGPLRSHDPEENRVLFLALMIQSELPATVGIWQPRGWRMNYTGSVSMEQLSRSGDCPLPAKVVNVLSAP